MATTPEPPGLPIRRAKLRPPRPGQGLVPRPRLMPQLDQSLHVPFTLVAAPAGFGKSTILSEWAADRTQPVAWLSLDAGDRDLRRFVTHFVAAIDTLAPGSGEPVLELLRGPHPIVATEVGAALADALLDLTEDVILIIDDYHLAASTNVERLLGGLLQASPPLFHLLLATRSDPALPLARMRLHGHVIELRAADLRFSDDEAHALLAAAGHTASPDLVSALQEQTGGWIAGLRLATLALPADADPSRIAESAAGEPLMDFLVEEVLAAQPEATQHFLLRTALLDQFSAPLADALLDQALPGGSRAVLNQLAHDSLFLEPVDEDGEWYRFHPLFRSLLLHQLDARLSPAERAGLHARASAWYADQGLIELAIHHRVVAGDVAGAATLVERHVPAALNREDWISVAGWLQALPEAVIHGSPALLLAKGWVSHFSGRSVPITAMLVELDALLATVDVDPAAIAAWEAERDALSLAALLPSTRDPIEAVACALRAVENAPANHRLAAGLAQFWLGCARQAVGRTDEAMRGLTKVAELHEDRIDAGSIRALGGLMFVHRQAGNFRACEEVSEQILTLARQNNLPVAAGWARWMLGWLAYEQDNLDSAAEHFTAVLDDAQRVHLHTLCEAMFGLALTYQARQKPGEAAGALGRLLEIILNATALEYLPLLRGFKARLALLQGEWQAAIDWLEMADFAGIDSSTLDGFEHPFLTRVKVLLAEGSEPSIARAMRDLEELRAHTAFIHHRAHQIEILALSAVMLNALEQTEEAVVALRESLSLAESAGFVRPYLDLGPALLPLLRRLSDMEPASAFLERLQRAVTGSPEAQTAHQAPIRLSLQSDAILELLTVREAEVLECLARRLSYKEISDELFISFHTVKSHATSIYDKLGVDNRRQAIARAQSLGWVPLGVPVSGTPERLTKTAGPIAT